ncbi:MAG: hypothetical protein WCO45_02925 [Pseudanabaena sp. ELA607]|jgi:hypothetical protein
MFELLINILVWVLVLPVAIAAYKAIPKEWFRILGLIIFGAIVFIAFSYFRFVEQPVPRLMLDIMNFPFTITGLALIWGTIHLKPLGGLKFKSGDKVDNKDTQKKFNNLLRQVTLVAIVLAIASNNFFAEILVCYLGEQANGAIEQSYRRSVKNLTEADRLTIQRDRYDLIIVMAAPASVQNRLIEAVRIWKGSPQDGKPLILVSGGRVLDSEKIYPCQIRGEILPNRTKEMIRRDVLKFKYDSRFEGMFQDPKNTTEMVNSVDFSEADQMCSFLTNAPNNVPRSSIIIDSKSSVVRFTGDTVLELQKKKIVPNSEQRNTRILLITSPIEASRAFLSFRNQNLNVIMRVMPLSSNTSNSNLFTFNRCPIFMGKFRFKLEYLFFSGQAYMQTEMIWAEFRELVLYTLRFWLTPPLTDDPDYYPAPAKTAKPKTSMARNL